MALFSRIQALLRRVFRRSHADQDLDAEVRSYAELLAQEKIRSGMQPEGARRAAQLELGGVEQVKEEVRAARPGAWLETLWQDVRFGARMLRKSPGFTSVAVLTLALGIGANTAIFSVVDAVLLRPLPFPASDRLVRMWEMKPELSYFRNVVNGLNFLEWREQNHTFQSMAAIADATVNLKINGEPLAVQGLSVSTEFFSVLRAPPYLGRTFTAQDGIPGRDNSAILSYEFWQKQFGGMKDIIGKKLG